MLFPILIILLCTNSIFLINGDIITMAQLHSSWIYDGGRFMKYLWDDCSMTVKPIHNANHKIINDTYTDNSNNYVNTYYYDKMQKIIQPSTIECLKRKSLIALDRALDADIIPLVDNIDMVRYHLEQHKDDAAAYIYSGKSRPSLPKVNIGDNMVSENNSNVTDWKTSVIMRLADVFRTHVVKINFNKSDTSEFRSSDNYFSARRRRHRHMMPIMMFGTIAMGMLLIPMGFKFLAVLGGKALLLAKMALLLASIQGLKRIATSGVNYGLYTQYPTAGWHERHGRVELSSPTVPYAYDTQPIFEHGPQADLQMSVGR